MLYYLLTIDKVSDLENKPSINSYLKILQILCKKFKFDISFPPRNIIIFEYKRSNWIHLHTIVQSEKYINYKDIKRKGYSVNLKYIRNMQMLGDVISYLLRNVKDEVQIDQSYIPNIEFTTLEKKRIYIDQKLINLEKMIVNKKKIL